MPFLVPPPGTLPPTYVPPKPLELRGVTVVWEGWNGSRWTLSGDPRSPIRLLSGTSMFGMPEFIHFEDEYAGMDGSQWLAWRSPKRIYSWVLGVFDRRGEQVWADLDDAFWDTMDPERPGVLSVTQPNGETRSVRMRFLSDNAHVTITDPLLTGREVYQIDLQSEWPYPQGEPIVQTFGAADDHDLYPDVDTDDWVFWWSPGDTVDSATISNPGQIDAYLSYVVEGPTTSVTVRGTELDFTIAAGKAVLLDTDPRSQVALEANVSTGADGGKVYTLTGVDKSGSLGAVNFTPLEPGQSVPVTMTMTGTGSVTVTLVPSYRRFR